MAESIRPATGTEGQDATAIYALGSSPGESARLQQQAEELAADSAALLDGWACGQDRPRSIWAAARAGSWTCWLIGSRQQDGSSAWTPTPRTPPWLPTSPPGGG